MPREKEKKRKKTRGTKKVRKATKIESQFDLISISEKFSRQSCRAHCESSTP